MLDYTKYLNNSFRFILYFEVVDNNIVVHYVKEDDLVIPYSKDTEKFLLILMRIKCCLFMILIYNFVKNIITLIILFLIYLV